MSLGINHMVVKDYERLLTVFSEEMESSISSCFQKSLNKYEWVDSAEEARALARRFRGVFVASVVGEIEEKISRSFTSTFKQLSKIPTQKKSKYWCDAMPSTSSPRGRAQVMWAIRIAYTHGNGRVNQITDCKVVEYLDPSFVNQQFKGLQIENNNIQILRYVTYPVLKTALEIYEKFSGNSDQTE